MEELILLTLGAIYSPATLVLTQSTGTITLHCSKLFEAKKHQSKITEEYDHFKVASGKEASQKN